MLIFTNAEGKTVRAERVDNDNATIGLLARASGGRVERAHKRNVIRIVKADGTSRSAASGDWIVKSGSQWDVVNNELFSKRYNTAASPEEVALTDRKFLTGEDVHR